MPVLTSPLARGVGAAHPQVVALETQMRLRTSPGTPLPLMFKLHPSGALRGYESGERSPFCLGLCVSCSRSASLFKLHSRVARDARGAYLDGLSSECKISLCCIKSAHTPQVNGRGDHPFTMGWPAFSTSGTRRNTDHNDGDPPDVHRKLPSSAGEDRAVLLGFAMMGFSVLMFFVLGVTILKPFLLSTQREELNCTIIHVHTMDDWTDCAFTCGMDCRGQGKYLCLQLFVKLTHSGQKVLLHYNEEAVQINSKCFYTPKCHQHRNDLLSGALDIKEFLDHKNGTPFSCFYSPDSQSEDVILIKKYDQMVIFHCLFWPSLTLLGGVLIGGMHCAQQPRYGTT